MRVVVLMAAMAGFCWGAAYGQSPNVKLGLWENASTTTMQMPPAMADKMKGSPMGGGAPISSTTKSCVTQEVLDKGMAFQGAQREGCTNSERTVTPHGMTFTVTCSRPGGMTTVAKGSMVADGPDKATTEIHMEMQMPPNVGGTMVTNVKVVSKYLGADCGNVKPYTGMGKR